MQGSTQVQIVPGQAQCILWFPWLLSWKGILKQSGCFKPSSIRLSGVPLAPKDVQQVYQLKWGVCCALIRFDIFTILASLGLDHTWVLIAYLLDHAGISTSSKDYYNSDWHSRRWAAWLGIPIFGSDFWNSHRKRNSDSISDSGNSGRIFFRIPLLKSHQIRILIPKIRIPDFFT